MIYLNNRKINEIKIDESTGGDVSGKLDVAVYEEDKKTFALKSEIPNTDNFVTNEVLNGKGYLTEIPPEYITSSELFLNCYTKDEIDGQMGDINSLINTLKTMI